MQYTWGQLVTQTAAAILLLLLGVAYAGLWLINRH
jgi:hypothetical protein